MAVMVEPENPVLVLLREMRSDMSEICGDIADIRTVMADIRSTMATKEDLRSEIDSLRADVASGMVLLEKRLGERIPHLNRAVVEYHSSAVGHGVLISALDEMRAPDREAPRSRRTGPALTPKVLPGSPRATMGNSGRGRRRDDQTAHSGRTFWEFAGRGANSWALSGRARPKAYGGRSPMVS